MREFKFLVCLIIVFLMFSCVDPDATGARPDRKGGACFVWAVVEKLE